MTEPQIVRGMASGAIHLAHVPPAALHTLSQFNVEYTGTVLPVAALCGAVIGGRYGVVVMRPESRVTCRPCLRFASLAESFGVQPSREGD